MAFNNLVMCKPPKTSKGEIADQKVNVTSIELLKHIGDHVGNRTTMYQSNHLYLLPTTSPGSPSQTTMSAAPATMTSEITLGWFQGILLCLCIIGVSGNILNLLVLTRRRFCSSLNKLESSANYGLIALAVSDLCFCLVALPHVFLSGSTNPSLKAIQMYYRVFGLGTINLFLMTSTWIIIVIAINRVIVVVYPLHAKSFISRQSTIASILLVYIISILLTLPYYLHIAIQQCKTPDGNVSYQFYEYYSKWVTKGLRIYIRWVWPITADFIPLLILGMCNARLVYEIRRAASAKHGALVRRSSHRNIRSSGSKVTVTLISIIVMYLLLVTPCEIMKYINPYKAWGKIGYHIADATNALQTANFAFNFVVYCVVNATFRQTLKDMVRPSRTNSSSMSVKSMNGMASEMEERHVMIYRERNSRNCTTLSTL